LWSSELEHIWEIGSDIYCPEPAAGRSVDEADLLLAGSHDQAGRESLLEPDGEQSVEFGSAS